LFLLLALSSVLAACGDEREPAPRRSAIPVIVYHGITPDAAGQDVTPEQFTRQMTRLAEAGYQTIGLRTLAQFLRGERVPLPARPFVLTFDDGRLDSHERADPVLEEHGFTATLFVDTGRVDARVAGYLDWRQLDQLGPRWDVQLQSGTGNLLIRYGNHPREVGPFYAYRGEQEVLGGWRERVFGDIAWAERQLARRVRSYRPFAFSPPYGNYGQAGTNDPEIPRLLLARLHASFPLVLIQNGEALARRGQGASKPIGRLAMTRDHGERDLLALLARHADATARQRPTARNAP
jgi:peptidoglycan/xylan/chitin deacetylase (PgdA/CDA1 family)